MTAEQEALFERAHRALETARVNLGADDAPAAVNRAYYAVYPSDNLPITAMNDERLLDPRLEKEDIRACLLFSVRALSDSSFMPLQAA